MVTAATIYISLLGYKGLKRVALASHEQTKKLQVLLTAIDGVQPRFDGAFFHEVVVTLDRPVAAVLHELAARDILGGLDLSADHPGLGNAMLICATETKTDSDLNRYADALAAILA